MFSEGPREEVDPLSGNYVDNFPALASFLFLNRLWNLSSFTLFRLTNVQYIHKDRLPSLGF